MKLKHGIYLAQLLSHLVIETVQVATSLNGKYENLNWLRCIKECGLKQSVR